MRDEWRAVFDLADEVDFGPILDESKCDLFCEDDETLTSRMYELLFQLTSTDANVNILVGGDAGVGKTTIFHYIKARKIDPSKYDLRIINAENRLNVDSVVRKAADEILGHLESVAAELKQNKKSGYTAISQQIEASIADSYYDPYPDKVHMFVDLLDSLWADSKRMIHFDIPRPIIVLDQVDVFDGTDTVANINACFSPLLGAKHVTAAVCARKETITAAKRSNNNFFATKFSHRTEVDTVHITKVFQKRLSAASNVNVTLRQMREYFPEHFSEFLMSTQNGNIRNQLKILRELMSTLEPVTGRGTTHSYMDYLIRHEYITDLYRRINPDDTVPTVKLVFDALHHHSTVDDKFIQAVQATAETKTRGARGTSPANIRNAVRILEDQSIVAYSHELPDHYVLTKKGEEFTRLVRNPVYQKVYCVHENDPTYSADPFTDMQFYR